MLNIYNRRFDNKYITQKQLRLALCKCCNTYWSGTDPVPDLDLGDPGDHYFNYDNGDLWKKEEDDSTWTLIFQHAEVGSEYSVENGLHASAGDPSIFHLGGPLIENTTILYTDFRLEILDDASGASPFFTRTRFDSATGSVTNTSLAPTDAGNNIVESFSNLGWILTATINCFCIFAASTRDRIEPSYWERRNSTANGETPIMGAINSRPGIEFHANGSDILTPLAGEFYRFPLSDGTPLQVLGTNGIGQLDWYNNPAAAVYTSDNAITLTGFNFQLGGSLVQDTEILSETFDLDINKTPWEINDASGQATFQLSDDFLGSGFSGILAGAGDKFAEHSQLAIGDILMSGGWYEAVSGADSSILADATKLLLRSTDGINATQIDINQSAAIGFLSDTGQYTFASVGTDNTETQILTLQTGTDELKIRDLSTLPDTNFLNTDLGPPLANRLHDGTGFSWQFDNGQNYRIQDWFTMSLTATDGVILGTQNNDATLSSSSGNASLLAGNIAQISGIGQVQIKTPAHLGKAMGDVLTLQDPATGRVEYETLTNPVSVVRTIGPVYALLGTEDLILCDCTANNITVQFPPAVTLIKRVTIKKTDVSVNTVTILPNGIETVDAVGSITWAVQNQAYGIFPEVAFSTLWTV